MEEKKKLGLFSVIATGVGVNCCNKLPFIPGAGSWNNRNPFYHIYDFSMYA